MTLYDFLGFSSSTLIELAKSIQFSFSFSLCPPSSSQWTPTHLPYTSTVPCWFPLAVLPRCPPPCCRWKTQTVRLSSLSSTLSGAPATDSWSCSDGRKEKGTEGWQIGNWSGTTPSPGRSYKMAGSVWSTEKTKPGKWIWCGLFRVRIAL